jgi:hypothetical protein
VKRLVPALVAAMLSCCSPAKTIRPVEPEFRPGIEEVCRSVFPLPPWSVTHAIEITLPDGKRSVLTGASVAGAEPYTIRSVLMSPEGMVLFDASWSKGEIQTHRALPPLEDPVFAKRLFEDVRLMFSAPADPPVEAGILEDGRKSCRYRDGDSVTDVILEPEGGWTIRDRATRDHVIREVKAQPPVTRGFAGHMTLEVSGETNYRMGFELVDQGS